MALKILHTSDLHIGKKFAGYEGDLRDALIDARFACLERLVQTANKNKCDLLVVAGDLFDRPDVAKRDVLRAAETLRQFEGHIAALLPGNHDYLAPDKSGTWQTLRDTGGDNLLLLQRPEPVSLVSCDLQAVLYPAPCTSKHSKDNAVHWICDAEVDASVPLHIGVAHGSLDGVSPDFGGDYYPMTHSELDAAPVSIWLLGHTHIRYPEQPGLSNRIFYAGTPEPDGFDCDHPGGAWIHELSNDGTCASEPVATGQYRFLHEEINLRDEQDVAKLKALYSTEDRSKRLLKLTVTGRLQGEVYSQLGAIRGELEKEFAWLHWDDTNLTRRITREDIDTSFTTGSFPHQLLTKLAESDNDAEALQEAHRLIMEVRK